jgi:long-chain acyl-CoA synthetase
MKIYNNIVEFFYDRCEAYSNNTFIKNFDNTLFSYREMASISCMTYHFFKNFDLKENDKVSILLPNIPEYIPLLIGVWSHASIAVNLNINFTADECKTRLIDAEVSMVITTADLYSKFKNMISELNINKILIVGSDISINQPLYNFDLIKNAGFSNVVFIPIYNSTTTAFLQYTGGTSGGVKAAMITHGNVVSNVFQIRRHFGENLLENDEVMPATFPLYHVFALTFNVFTFFSVGATCLMYPITKDLPQLINLIKQNKITCFVGVNTLYKLLIQSSQLHKSDFSNLKVCIGGGEHIQYKTKIDWQNLSGAPIYEAYGMTETSAMAIVNPIDEHNDLETIGNPIPDTEVRLVDENNNFILEDNVYGEIILKGPQVISQYWNKPDENKTSFMDGWLRTGDIAIWKNGNYLKIVDRKKDMISVSGFKVFPNEVEAVITTFEGIMDCAVIGEKDEQTGERVVLYYVSDIQIDHQSLIEHCRKHLTSFKIPKKIIKTQLIPKTAIGKTMRSSLRNLQETI